MNGLFSVTGLAGFAITKTDQFTGGTLNAGNLSVTAAGNFEDIGATTNIGTLASFTNGLILQFGTTGSSTSFNLGALSVNGTNLNLDLGGVVTVTNGTTIAAKNEITMLGGTVSAGTGEISNAGTLTGYGLVKGSGSVSGAGTVFATGGKLELGISASAPLNIANGSGNILKLNAAETNAVVTFGGTTGGVLELADFKSGTPNSMNFTTSTVAAMGLLRDGNRPGHDQCPGHRQKRRRHRRQHPEVSDSSRWSPPSR